MRVQFIFGGTFDPPHFGHIIPLRSAASILKLPNIELMPSKIPAHKTQPIASVQQRLKMLELVQKQYPEFVVQAFELKLEHEATYTVDTLTALKQHSANTNIVFIMGSDSWINFKTWHRYSEILNLCHIIVLSRPVKRIILPTQSSATSDNIDDNQHLSLSKQLALAKSLGLRCYMSSSSEQDQVSLCHETWCQQSHGSITFVETQEMDISSSELRAFFQHGKKLASKTYNNADKQRDRISCDAIRQINSIGEFVPHAILEYINKHGLYGSNVSGTVRHTK